MSRPILCDGCGELVNPRGTVYVLQVFPPLEALDLDDTPRSPRLVDVCSPACLEGWAAAVQATPSPR